MLLPSAPYNSYHPHHSQGSRDGGVLVIKLQTFSHLIVRCHVSAFFSSSLLPPVLLIVDPPAPPHTNPSPAVPFLGKKAGNHNRWILVCLCVSYKYFMSIHPVVSFFLEVLLMEV